MAGKNIGYGGIGGSGIFGLFGSTVTCKSDDNSFYCNFVKFFNLFIMTLVIFFIIYYAYIFLFAPMFYKKNK